jgi:hypothetical protein
MNMLAHLELLKRKGFGEILTGLGFIIDLTVVKKINVW